MKRLVFIFLLVAAPVVVAEVADLEERQAICKELSEEVMGELSDNTSRDYRLYEVDAFYSEKLDSCIHVEAHLFGPEVQVRDLTRMIIRDAGHYYPPMLLHCDAHGVDQADIEVVRKLGGHVRHVSYEKWLTDGKGGLPRTLKSAPDPFNRIDCEAALDRWLDRWK